VNENCGQEIKELVYSHNGRSVHHVVVFLNKKNEHVLLLDVFLDAIVHPVAFFRVAVFLFLLSISDPAFNLGLPVQVSL
jgi:hypothetical protein